MEALPKQEKLPCVIKKKKKVKHFKAFWGNEWKKERQVAAVYFGGECRAEEIVVFLYIYFIIKQPHCWFFSVESGYFSKYKLCHFCPNTIEINVNFPKHPKQSWTKTDTLSSVLWVRQEWVIFMREKVSLLCACMACYWLTYCKQQESFLTASLLCVCTYTTFEEGTE